MGSRARLASFSKKVLERIREANSASWGWFI